MLDLFILVLSPYPGVHSSRHGTHVLKVPWWVTLVRVVLERHRRLSTDSYLLQPLRYLSMLMAVRVWGMCQTWHPSQTSRSESDSAFMVQVFAVLSHGLLQKQLVVFVQLVPSTSRWCCSCWLLFFSRSFRGSLFATFLVPSVLVSSP